MSHFPRPYQVRVGAATVTILTVGWWQWVLAEQLTPPASGWTADELEQISRPARIPFLCAHIALGDASIVVDAMDAAEFIRANGEPMTEEVLAVPRLDAQLTGLGIAPEGVTQVVVTHAHYDHYNVSTVVDEATGERRLLFPNATYIAERADWTRVNGHLPEPEQEMIMDEVFRQDRMHLVDGDVELAPGIRLIATPGESPGHAIVRVHSEGETLYCLGDLFHSTAEIDHLDAMPSWADHERMLASRRALVEAAVREHAQLMVAHIDGIGRLRAMPDGRVAWEPTADAR